MRLCAMALGATLVLAGCECAGGLPSALRTYGDGYDVVRATEWTLAGYRFSRVSVIGADPPSTQIVALDEATGERVEGAALFALFSDLPPEGLASHACFTLLDGCTPLADADPRAATALGGDASLVRAPHLDDQDRLVFDVVRDRPTLEATRVTVDVRGGRIASRATLHAPDAASEPETIRVTLGVSATPPSFVTATYTAPATIDGCISAVAGACVATTRVTLDEEANDELTRWVADVRAMPRCEPGGIEPGDLDYTLSWPGSPSYVGSVPPDASRMEGRNAGPCHADARLAWWIASRIVAAARPVPPTP
jgi:hypothetical protein